MARIKGKKRIVVKVGTSTLTHQTGKTNIARLAKLASVLSDLKNEGHEIVLVSSGAIAVGWSKLGLSEKPKTVQGLQASAAVGQCELMFLYDKLFSEYTVTVSQLLFSADTLRNPEEKEHLVDTFNQLLDYGALPIINENDSVYIEELLNGDNDCLSAMVATLIDADLHIMLTDTYGLYDSNPSENDDAKLIGVVEEIAALERHLIALAPRIGVVDADGVDRRHAALRAHHVIAHAAATSATAARDAQNVLEREILLVDVVEQVDE